MATQYRKVSRAGRPTIYVPSEIAGISTEALEAGAVARLVEAARKAENLIDAALDIGIEEIEGSEEVWHQLHDALAPFDKETT